MDVLKSFQKLAQPILLSCAFLAVSSTPSLAEIKLKYIPDKANVRKVVLENETMRYTLSLDGSVKLSGAVNIANGSDALAGNPDLLFLSVRNRLWLDDVGFHLVTIKDKQTARSVSVTITQQSSYVENPLILTQTFSLGNGPELEWNAKVRNTATGGRSYRAPRTWYSEIAFPLMQKIRIGKESENHYLIPTHH